MAPRLPASTSFRSGDLLFVEPPFDPSQPVDNAILAVGNATLAWLRSHGVATPTHQTSVHVGLVYRNGSTLAVIEAVPPAVRITPWSAFFETWKSATFYHATPEKHLQEHGHAAAQLALTQLGAPYSSEFAPPSTGEFYCSSLVQWAYKSATKDAQALMPTRDPFPLIFVPRDFWRDCASRTLRGSETHARWHAPTLVPSCHRHHAIALMTTRRVLCDCA